MLPGRATRLGFPRFDNPPIFVALLGAEARALRFQPAGEYWIERRYLSLAYAEGAPAVIPLLREAARTGMEWSARWWRDWAGRGADQGPSREAIVRSAWALKLLTYAPSGAIIAAPTVSPPEKPGGVRTWDYRSCRLRDGSFTVRPLFALGYRVESRQLITWWLGAAIRLVQALLVLGAAIPALPARHPRMASERPGPTPTKQFEPPGFLASSYGRRTPLSVVLAHLVSGDILRALCRVS